MTTTLAAPGLPAATIPDVPSASIGTLIGVELRKSVDTRAGRWLLIITGLLAVALVVIFLFAGHADNRTWHMFFTGTLYPVALLIPVIGVLSVTSEWSQKTKLVTFALVPSRFRIVAAKTGAAVILAVASVVICLGVSALGNLVTNVAHHGDGSWHLPLSLIGQALVYEIMAILGGQAFGWLFMNSAVGIVLLFLLPIAWNILSSIITGLHGVQPWLNTSDSYAPLTDTGVTARDWARIATSTGVWVGIPYVIGLIRLNRQEMS